MKKEEKILYPTQCGSSVSEYIKMIKLYVIGIDEDLNGIDIKVKFICELSPVNEKRVHEFGVKKPLSEIFEHLLKPPTNLADRTAILIFAYIDKKLHANQYLYFFP